LESWGHRHGNFPETSGDDRNDLQILLMGQPGTDRERAEVARLTAQQQIDQAGALGQLLAMRNTTISSTARTSCASRWGFRPRNMRMRSTSAALRQENPVTGKPTRWAISTNRATFNRRQGQRPPVEDFVTMATLSAENYKQATDRVAT